MSFTKEKREEIKKYILKLIDTNETDFIKKTIENRKVSRQTVYRYLEELEKDLSIRKSTKNGKYMVWGEQHFHSLENIDLEEHTVYNDLVYKHIENLPDNVKRIWQHGFTEMFNNAIDHSESKEIDFMIIVNHLFTMIIIYDIGIGIFNKIKGYYKLDSIESAITELLKGKLTTDSSKHSGEGIFFSSRMFDEFCIYSSGKCFRHNNYFDIVESLELPIDKGTVVIMKLSNESKRTITEVFDMYSSVDGGFIKTEIKITDTVDNGVPASRSQAKRLYNRFEEFEQVVLDFEDVSDIGQGYAHELFVVFRTQHPDVSLEVKNANKQVLRMINHATKGNFIIN